MVIIKPRSGVCSLFIGFLLSLSLSLRAELPSKPVPTRFVCDYAGVLDATRAERLNTALQLLSDSTTCQVVVVTIADLEGYEPIDYAVRLGRSWGVGTKERNNGVIILLKPRNEHGSGAVEIATGYGAEGALTDVMCGHIIDTRMMPHLREGDYTSAAEAGARACAERLSAEYADGWMPDGWLGGSSDLDTLGDDDFYLGVAVIVGSLLFVVVLLPLIRKRSRKSAALDRIRQATSTTQRDEAIRAAEAMKISRSAIDSAVRDIPDRLLRTMTAASSPAAFASLTAGAIALGVPIDRITDLEMRLPGLTLQEVRDSRSTSALERAIRRARAFGNSEEAIRAAAAIAQAAIAAAALIAARAARSSSRSSGSFSAGPSHSSFGGGSFGGGGAGRRF